MKGTQFTNFTKFWQKKAKTFLYLTGILILLTSTADAQVPNLLLKATSNTTNTSKSQTAGVAVDASESIYSVGPSWHLVCTKRTKINSHAG